MAVKPLWSWGGAKWFNPYSLGDKQNGRITHTVSRRCEMTMYRFGVKQPLKPWVCTLQGGGGATTTGPNATTS